MTKKEAEVLELAYTFRDAWYAWLRSSNDVAAVAKKEEASLLFRIAAVNLEERSVFEEGCK